MADSERTASATARIVISKLVPEGRTMVEVESPEETVIVVREGHMSPELAEEWNHHLDHLTRSGRWVRTETDEPETPEGHPPV